MTQRLCERCNAEIPEERIQIVPETRLCVKCCEEVGGEFKLYATYERTSKEGSLKKNYGGVNVFRVRKEIKKKGEE
jgi:hypothetical protein